MKGKLILIPTPIDEESHLEAQAFNLLEDAFNNHFSESVFVVEDIKPGRRRWIRWGLPREAVEHFKTYNEHNWKESVNDLVRDLKSGKRVFLLSDGGLPAFCDPGRELVRSCHDMGIPVTSTPFANSVVLALALSGFNHSEFHFAGFLPREKDKRKQKLANIYNGKKETTIIMDTPYRLKRLIEELKVLENGSSKRRQAFLALDLNSSSEELLRGDAHQLFQKLKDFKREFILILSSCA